VFVKPLGNLFDLLLSGFLLGNLASVGLASGVSDANLDTLFDERSNDTASGAWDGFDHCVFLS